MTQQQLPYEGMYAEQLALDELHRRQRQDLVDAMKKLDWHRELTVWRVLILIFEVTKSSDGILRWTAEKIGEDRTVARNERSVRRALREAESLGLIESKRGFRFRSHRKEISIIWNHVRCVAKGDVLPLNSESQSEITGQQTGQQTGQLTGQQTGQQTGHSDLHICSSIRPINQISSRPVVPTKAESPKLENPLREKPPLAHSSTERRNDVLDLMEFSEDDLAQAWYLFDRLGREVGFDFTQRERDFEFAMKVCAMVAKGLLPECWLWEISREMRRCRKDRIRSPVGYLIHSLTRRAANVAIDLNSHIGRVFLPPDLQYLNPV